MAEGIKKDSDFELKSLLIGILIITVGYMTQSLLLMVLGVLLSILDFFLEKPEQVKYEYVDNKPRVIVVNSKPPKDRIPIPAEEPSPLGKAIYDKELKPLENQLAKLKIDYLASSGKTKEEIRKKAEKVQKEYLERKSKLAVLPFGVKKEEGNPVSNFFRGIGINWSLKMLSNIFGKKKD